MRRLLISSAAMMAVLSAAPALAQTSAPAQTAAAESEDARLNAFFEQAFQARIALSPQQMTSLGIKTDYDKLDDVSDAAADRALALQEAQLAQMKAQFDPQKLGPQAALSWRMFEYGVQQARLSNRWRDWGYQFAANGNPTTSLPVFLINNHRISSVSDAEAYVSRITEAERYMGQVATTLKARAAEGVVSPRFVFAPSIANTRNVVTGAPYPVVDDHQSFRIFGGGGEAGDHDIVTNLFLQGRRQLAQVTVAQGAIGVDAQGGHDADVHLELLQVGHGAVAFALGRGAAGIERRG